MSDGACCTRGTMAAMDEKLADDGGDSATTAAATRPVRPYRLPLLLAVISAVAFATFAVATAVSRRDRTALPGAVGALVLYLTLGYFVLRGHQWARWTLFALMLLTGLTSLVFGLFIAPWSQGGMALLLSSVFFGVVASMLAGPVRGSGPRG